MTPDEWLADFEAKTAELRRKEIAFRNPKSATLSVRVGSLRVRTRWLMQSSGTTQVR